MAKVWSRTESWTVLTVSSHQRLHARVTALGTHSHPISVLPKDVSPLLNTLIGEQVVTVHKRPRNTLYTNFVTLPMIIPKIQGVTTKICPRSLTREYGFILGAWRVASLEMGWENKSPFQILHSTLTLLKFIVDKSHSVYLLNKSSELSW